MDADYDLFEIASVINGFRGDGAKNLYLGGFQLAAILEPSMYRHDNKDFPANEKMFPLRIAGSRRNA